jgi:hypothetical protein
LEWLRRQQRAPFGRPIAALSFLFLGLVQVMASQPRNTAPACLGLKLEIRVPDEIVRPQSNLPLEMKLTNIGKVETWLPSGSPDIWGYEVDLRDAQDAPVPRTSEWMRAISERPTNITLNVSLPLAAGASISKAVILDKLFDLRKPGKYTIRVSFDSFACGNSGTRVTSNLLHFTVDERSKGLSRSKPGISITASAPRANLPIGWAFPLDIVVQNNSTHSLKWAVDNPPNTAPDEFLTGAEVFSAVGELRPPPPAAEPNWSLSRFRDTVSILEIPPGKSAEQIVLLGDLFDIAKPGEYRASVSLVDPTSNQIVDSNTVSFEVKNSEASNPLPKRPPFIVTLWPANFLPPNPGNVLICMSNISDHDIRLDNSAGKDFQFVEDADGNKAALTEAGLTLWKPEYLKQAPADFEACCNWATVAPRKALCGGMNLGATYDLSRPGTYRARIDRYDESDAMPGQKVGELPLVHSNWLTIFEP